MIFMFSLLAMAGFAWVSLHYPIYAVVWAVINTFAYIGVVTDKTYKGFKDFTAAVLIWFVAPLGYIMED